MSSDDITGRRGAMPSRRAVLTGGLAIGAIGLAGCTVQPLYGTVPGSSGATTMSEFKAIKVDEQSSRVQQVLRNALIYDFTGGGDADDHPRYRLRFILSESTASVAIQSMSQVPTQILLTINVSFYLIDIATNRTLLTGTSFANASYTFSSQRFANTRAQMDAENRAAQSVADDIRIRLATYFATHPAVK